MYKLNTARPWEKSKPRAASCRTLSNPWHGLTQAMRKGAHGQDRDLRAQNFPKAA